MSEQSIFRWNGSALQPLSDDQSADGTILAADSWLVTAGSALALTLHEERFAAAVSEAALSSPTTPQQLTSFWTAAVASIPHEGDWFPRVELQLLGGASQFILRLRGVPVRTRSVTVATHRGTDPRTMPRIKGPDLAAMAAIRSMAATAGAEEAIILSPDGFVVEGAYSALLWWRGTVLCVPSTELQRIDSVTARTVIALATAFGHDVYYESVTPTELDGCEIWAVSALHGIRIVTRWVDGPAPAEQPGRLETWRRRLQKLLQPVPIAAD